MPGRFVKFDLVDRLSSHLPEPAGQALIGLLCALLAVLARTVIDLVLPNAGPFALTLPFVLFATLFGRWGAGLGAMCFCALYAWYYVLPISGSFRFENPADGPRVVVNVLSGILVVALAEYFRRIVRGSLQERDAIAEERRLLLEELDHRVKNNFAMVSAMIRMEMRSATEPDAAALKAMHGRIESIARAHQALYRGEGGVGEVPMRPYLVNLCASLNTALFHGNHKVTAEVADISLGRDKAIAIGLVVNELCTNAAKHAFPGRDNGHVEVDLSLSGDTVVVSVSDDGVGLPDGPLRQGSLGQGLIGAFAEQAGGTLENVKTEIGTKFQLSLPISRER